MSGPGTRMQARLHQLLTMMMEYGSTRWNRVGGRGGGYWIRVWLGQRGGVAAIAAVAIAMAAMATRRVRAGWCKNVRGNHCSQ